jgi:multiple sugar transport system substrate-binding protein
MARIDRRRLLKLSGAGAMAAIFASGRAPAYAQGTSLQWLKFVDFVPVSDQLLRGKITEQRFDGLATRNWKFESISLQRRVTSKKRQ